MYHVMTTDYYVMVSIWFAHSATVGSRDIIMKYAQFKCNGCSRKTEFLWLEQLDTPDGFKAYQCMDCGCVGVKNIAEALDIPDSKLDRCKQCGGWQFLGTGCHTCALIGAK